MSKKPKLSKNSLRLVLIACLFLASLILPSLLINRYWMHLPCYLPWLIGLLPFLTLLGCLAFNGGLRDPGRLPSIKYSSICPFFFYYDPTPKHYRFKKTDELKARLQPYDVLLRHHDTYIDGLILGQTSYFTHAAIYTGEEGSEIIDAIGSRGIGPCSLEEFSRCDDIAVVRFDINKITENGWASQPHETEPHYAFESLGWDAINDFFYPKPYTVLNDKTPRVNVAKVIHQDIDSDDPVLKALGQDQLTLFDSLRTSLKNPPVAINVSDIDTFMPSILKIGACYKGRGYDYTFNFHDEDKQSCVEFVWECYKALFPLHLIVPKITFYFAIVRTRVLVPDLFLTSDFFSLQYNSVERSITNARDLNDHIAPKRIKFRWFTLKIVVWQLGLLALVYLIRRLITK